MLVRYLLPLWLSLLTSISSDTQDNQIFEDLLKKRNDYRTADKTYDYIVVGGGSAGGMAAIQLAKYGFKTLLIEAGPEPEITYNITIPGFSPRASEDEKISYEYFVKHYPESTNLRQSVFYPRVGALGGCSMHHAQITVYPQNRDFEILYQLTGNPVFKEVNFRNKYFKPMEKNQYQLLVSNPDDHGYNGWYPTSYIEYLRLISLDPSLLKMIAFLGGDGSFDINGYDRKNRTQLMSEKEGLFFIPHAVNNMNQTRMNYILQLQMARAFNGLTILTDTLATKLLFDENKKATGVEVRHGSYLYKASPLYKQNSFENSVKNTFLATKEIIVSAGTFNTPQLLMLSGIGDSDELKKLNIDVISDLKGVGKNLQDRDEIPYMLKLNSDLNLFKECNFKADYKNDRCFRDYINFKTGPYTVGSGISAETYKSLPGLGAADNFIINTPLYFYGYFKGYSQVAADNPRYFTRLVLKARTQSQGYVKLKSADPTDTPDINLLKFNIGGKEDLTSLVNTIEYLRNQTKKNLGDTYEEEFPGKEIKTRDQIAKWITEITWGHHVCCTAKIGLDNDKMAVLDNKFSVRGVTGLRVMDMSALPEIPGFFPNLYIHMLGTYIADQIYEESKGKSKELKQQPSEELLNSINKKMDRNYIDILNPVIDT